MSTLTKRLSWALALSIGLNLFLIGFGGARWFRMRGPHGNPSAQHGPHGEGGHGGPAAWRALVPPTPELRAQHRSLTDARHAVGAALSADPYDAARLEQSLSALRSSTSKSQALLHERLLEQAGKLSLVQRRELASSRFLRGGPGEETPPAP